MADRATISVRKFGAVGDGVADDTDALQQALEATVNGSRSALVYIPPGNYRVTRPLRVTSEGRGKGNMVTAAGFLAHGAVIRSEIDTGEPVITIDIRAIVRFYLIQGLQVRGKHRREGHGIQILAENRGTYFYNFCLRDVIVESIGGDGLHMVGNVFEGQLINCYFRDNGGEGATFAHGPKRENTVLSSVHVFGCVFGGNFGNGVSVLDGASDIGFYGCYFLLNKRYGMVADTGVSLLSHCGFENNHMGAEDFESGDAGLLLKLGGTLIGCFAYSIYNQTHLVRAYVSNYFSMIGCRASGGQRASRAQLAIIDGDDSHDVSIISCWGGVETSRKLQPVVMGSGVGARFGSEWNARNLVWLGDNCLWVDGDGHLRMKNGRPQGDKDGRTISG